MPVAGSEETGDVLPLDIRSNVHRKCLVVVAVAVELAIESVESVLYGSTDVEVNYIKCGVTSFGNVRRK